MRGDKLFAPQEDQNAFTDILFNALLGFAFMFSVAFILIRPEVTDGKINPKAEFMITAHGPTGMKTILTLSSRMAKAIWFGSMRAKLD